MRHLWVKNTTGGSLARGDVVRMAGTAIHTGTMPQSTIDVAMPVPARLMIYAVESERVLACARALATADLTAVTVGVVLDAVGPDSMFACQTDGLFDYALSGNPAAGDPVYVSDAGALALTPGTNPRQVGYVLESASGVYRVWLDGIAPGVGPQGTAGPIGPPGAPGADGDEGPPGPQGPAGPAGAAGAQGPIGPPGVPGADGDEGPPGPIGPAGAAGATGPAGADGMRGAPGIDGDEGDVGWPGPAGAAGPAGATGPMGLMGPPGYEGDDGDWGWPGPAGPTGPQGPAGGGGGTATTVEKDLGSTPAWQGTFTITDAAIGTSSKVLVWQAPGPYTGKGTLADEAALAPVQVLVTESLSGSCKVYWQTPPVYVPVPVLFPLWGRHGTTAPNSQDDPHDYVVYQRRGLVKGNVKFTYLVLG